MASYVDQKFKEKKQPKNLDHLRAGHNCDKHLYAKVRSSIQPINQFTDFTFLNNAQVLAVTRSGILKTFDFFSGDLESNNYSWLNE